MHTNEKYHVKTLNWSCKEPSMNIETRPCNRGAPEANNVFPRSLSLNAKVASRIFL